MTPENSEPDKALGSDATKPAAKPEKPAKKPVEQPPMLVLASSPHIRSKETIERAMYKVVLALLPALAGAVFFFGLDALRVTIWCVAGCLAFEALCLAMTDEQERVGRTLLDILRVTIMLFFYIVTFRTLSLPMAKQKRMVRTLFDGSAILTGILLAMNLPSNAPWWLALAGAFVAMVVAKHVFGGLGANPFNPALVARIFLLIAWPARMTSWPIPRYAPESLAANADAVTAATPLGVLGADGLAAMEGQFPLWNVCVGSIGGSLGETSAILLLIGGVFLIATKTIRWEIPVTYIGTMGLLSTIAWLVSPEKMAHPLFHLAAGGLFLGAFFMATDYVTSPLSPKGMLVFGVSCGLLTFVIRFFGSFPEGVSFAIVIMNSLVPLIDRYFVPKRFGLEPRPAAS